MMRAILTLTLGLLAIAATPLHAGAGSCADPDGDERLDRLIVRMLPGQPIDEFITAIEQDYPGLTGQVSDSIPGRPIFLLDLAIPPDYTEAQLDAIEEDLVTAYPLLIGWAEFAYTDEAPEGNTGSTFVDGPITNLMYANQYASGVTGVPQSHGLSLGQGIVVAVLDTGLDLTHPLFAGHIAPGGIDLVENDADPSDLGDGLDNDNDLLTDEMTGHGTFVSGLVLLVAPEAAILPVRVINSDGNGELWSMAKGIFYAIDRGVEVINLSISSTYNSQAVEDAMDEAKSLGIPVVAAAGNCAREEPEEYPAMTSNAFGVAATDENDIKWPQSNYGDKIVICSPGASFFDINGADPDRSIISAIPGGELAYWEGTSMATPFVTGAVALIRAQHPEWPSNELTNNVLKQTLTSAAVNIDFLNPGFEGALGAGRLDIAAAVAAGPPAPGPGDLNASGLVDISDLLIMLGEWGLVHSSADLDGDGLVGLTDLLLLLGHWGT